MRGARICDMCFHLATGKAPWQSHWPMFDPMRTIDLSDAPGITTAAQHVYGTLRDCLARLDALDEPVAAAHLSACLDSLGAHFNPDASMSKMG